MTAVAEEREERIRLVLDALVHEREGLRAAADDALLEANRLSIVYWQAKLSRRPIARKQRRI